MIIFATMVTGWKIMEVAMNKSMQMKMEVELADHSNISLITNERINANEVNEHLRNQTSSEYPPKTKCKYD